MVKIRCKWAESTPEMQYYHDKEYGFPVTDNDVIFERLMLEIYQAGLTWKLILSKREGFNNAFNGYIIEKVANMTDKELEMQRENSDIVRNKMKIETTRHNAQTCLRIIKEHGSLINYFRSLPHEYSKLDELKPTVKLMKKDGFKFIGPLILEEFFLSIGINKVRHEKSCFLFK
ncbi:MAG: DNA-3-methyladenine glycosylase I [Candidatus Kariarchaeaceae archaeon]|jgi:DNA-3-methyladenine glycosylase I